MQRGQTANRTCGDGRRGGFEEVCGEIEVMNTLLTNIVMTLRFAQQSTSSGPRSRQIFVCRPECAVCYNDRAPDLASPRYEHKGSSQTSQRFYGDGVEDHQRVGQGGSADRGAGTKAIRELNFYPNTHARTLVSGRSRMLGLIISDITNPFFPELVKSFEDQALLRGQDVIIGNTDYQPKRMVGCIRRMLERKVDGVAILTSETDPECWKS